MGAEDVDALVVLSWCLSQTGGSAARVPGHAKRLREEDAVHVRQRHQFPERDELNQVCFRPATAAVSPLLLHSTQHVTWAPPPKLRHYHQILGLVLCFYVGSMEQSSLCMMFGAPPSTISRTLRHAEKALAGALDGYAPARISWPSPSRQAELAQLVEAREPLLKHTFGFIDGKNFKVQQPSNADLQNAMYNGWLHTVFVTGTICFAADGCIIWCKHNCPGSWNDSDTTFGFRTKLLDPTYCPDARMNVVSDSAFPCSTAMVGRILTPLKDGDLDRILPYLYCVRSCGHQHVQAVSLLSVS
ncbi:hypothetical protein ON010_g16803 [Phytophthora cinnamomi]|nr:hypothetical protein ON010_g16803 [Phytophthora cinnamomi]